jgi:Xaa-Pro aminopeptidase
MTVLDRIRAALDEANLDGLMISAPGEENIGVTSRRYVSGFTGSAGVVLVTRERAVIAADFRYTEQAERECAPRGFEVFPALGARTRHGFR